MSASDDQLKELVTIRKLLILALVRSGMSQTQIGAALGVHQTTIARMFPARAFGEPKKATSKKSASETQAETQE
jgi:IS30 family transposase